MFGLTEFSIADKRLDLTPISKYFVDMNKNAGF